MKDEISCKLINKLKEWHMNKLYVKYVVSEERILQSKAVCR